MSQSEDFETWQRPRRARFDPDIGDESPDGLYVHKIQSENREYSLYWADGHYWLTRGRQVRTEGPYPVFPTDNADARVANNGNFIISSASGKESYHIVFRAFTNEGVPIVERYFKSNRVNLGLSFDGKFAVCQTARGYDPDDSMLTMFDLELGTISWRRPIPRIRWAADYKFDMQNRKLWLVYPSKRTRYARKKYPQKQSTYAYSLAGEFLDESRWYRDEEARQFHCNGTPVTWRWKSMDEPPLLSKDVARALRSAKTDLTVHDTDGNSIETLRSLKLCDDDGHLTKRGIVEVVIPLSLDEQCRVLGFNLQKLRVQETKWPEIIAFEHFLSLGLKGGIIGGFGVVGTIYVLGFDVFQKIDRERNGPKAVRSPERTMGAFFSDLPEIRDELIDRILTADDNTIRKNLKTSKGQRRAKYFLGASVARLEHTGQYQVLNSYDLDDLGWLGPISKFDEFEFVSHLCSAVGVENLAKIANLLCQDSSAFYSRGWPDLMILGPNEFRFVEVKTTDKLHRSQIITMPEMHKVGGLDISVLQLVKG